MIFTNMIMASSNLFFLLLVLLHQSSPSPAVAQQTTYPSSTFSISNFPWTPTENRTLQSPHFSAGFLPTTTVSGDRLFNFSIWYTVDPATVLWSIKSSVSSSASITITSSGELRLTDHSSSENLWPGSPTGGRNLTLTLTGEGNLVFAGWESFSHPTDTFLPNQNIIGLKLTSGNYGFDGTQLSYNMSDVYWVSQSGSFQILGADGLLTLDGNVIYSADFGARRLRRLKLEDKGNLNLYSYDRKQGSWVVVWQAVEAVCWIHGLCGPNEICYNDGSNDHVTCECPYDLTSSGQCEIPYTRKTGQTSKFVRLDYVNYTGEVRDSSPATNYDECQERCTNDPDCLGFGFKYDGSGYCVPQRTYLKNGFWSPGTQAAMFLRINGNASDPVKSFTGMTEILQTTCNVTISLPVPPKESNTTTRNIVIITLLFTMELVIGVVSFWAFLKKYVKYRDMARTLGLELLPAGGPKRFSYAEIKQATEGFSTDNAIGKGAFGDVYKGVLSDHRIVAVKCLKDVAGGDTEFWAEVTIIARMHHLNLVRLWGFCNEKGNRILVYEYVPNGSLDKYLFRSRNAQANVSPPNNTTTSDTEDESEERPIIMEEKPLLDWNIRYRIAVGVARAIAYLHEECLEWVLHCDIKPENILLGDDFCPKISDFGLSKLKKKEQAASTMSGIRGTRGYLAPEWIKHEPITPKADVYSFGVVLLEMVSGTRSFEQQESQIDSAEWHLPTWAFNKVYKEMNVEDVLDQQIRHIYDGKEHLEMVSRMVTTAIWCLQERPDMRPSMGKVAKMLEGTVEIMEPPKPTLRFYHEE